MNSDSNNRTNRFRLKRVLAINHLCPNLIWFREDKFENESIFEIIREIAPTLVDTLVDCKWGYRSRNCEKTFVPTFTEVGLCFAYNALNSRDFFTNE